MSLKPLSRRTLLRGAKDIAIALPFLEAMLPRRATAAPTPKRFVFFFFANGVNPESWFLTGTPPAIGTLPPTLQPLTPLQSKLVLLSGVNMQTGQENRGNGHSVGITNLLVARKFIVDTMDNQAQFGAHGWGAGISIDQEIASRVGSGTPYPSLQFGVQSLKTYASNAYSYISYSGPGKPIPCEDSPQKMFTKLFSNIGAAAGDLQTRVDKRKSVLDYVTEDFRQVSSKVSASDRTKLDAHLTALRDIETRLTFTGQPGPSCARPNPTYPRDYSANVAFPATGKLQMDLLAMAFACDLTRVATLQWSTGQSGTTHHAVGATRAHHSYSHGTDVESVTMLQKIQTWYMTQLAYLGTSMAALKDSNGGTVLDSSVILAGSEVGVGQTHTHLNMPWVLLGSCGGAIKTNRWLAYNNVTHNDLYVSMMNAMGIPATSFGDPKYSRGPLPGLVG